MIYCSEELCIKILFRNLRQIILVCMARGKGRRDLFLDLADDRAIIGQKLHFIPKSGGNVQWIGGTVG